MSSLLSAARRLAAVAVLLVLTCASSGASADGFVYVLVGSSNPKVLVFDGTTGQATATISLPGAAHDTTPAGMAISPDGARMYVSLKKKSGPLGGSTTLAIIDLRRHQLAQWAFPDEQNAGALAVTPDGSRVLMLRPVSGSTPAAMLSFRPDDVSLESSLTLSGSDHRLTVDPVMSRVYVAWRDAPSPLVADVLHLDAYSPALALLKSSAPLGDAFADAPAAGGVTVSADGTRVHVTTTPLPLSGAPAEYHDHQFDARTLSRTSLRTLAVPHHPVELRNGTALITLGKSLENKIPPLFYVTRTPLDGSAATNIPIAGGPPAMGLSSSQALAFYTTVGNVDVVRLDTGTRFTSAAYGTPDPGVVDTNVIVATPAGAPSCSYQVDSHYASFAQVPGPGVPIHVAADCPWEATNVEPVPTPFLVPWIQIDTFTGVGNGVVTISVRPNLTGSTRVGRVFIAGQVITVTQAGAATAEPFGAFDTPVDRASGLTGSLGVTGWALDDVGVKAVHVFRDPVAGEPPALVALGDATMVEGARPDVASAFASRPFASRAGWGYMLLTNVLPGGGNGLYRLHVFLEDVEGHTTLLGSRTIVCGNATATLPFGAIDTPAQGDTVAGTITNWGWALTPQPAGIPVDGSTIDVVIDGVVVGHPAYGLDRPDIAALFPGYANTHSAVGYFTIDTTALTNGVHTIAWVVRDSLGRAQGIGSRYFSVQNP